MDGWMEGRKNIGMKGRDTVFLTLVVLKNDSRDIL